MGVPVLSEKEVETKISKFIDRKAEQFPELELRQPAHGSAKMGNKRIIDALQLLFTKLTIEAPRTRRQRA